MQKIEKHNRFAKQQWRLPTFFLGLIWAKKSHHAQNSSADKGYTLVFRSWHGLVYLITIFSRWDLHETALATVVSFPVRLCRVVPRVLDLYYTLPANTHTCSPGKNLEWINAGLRSFMRGATSLVMRKYASYGYT